MHGSHSEKGTNSGDYSAPYGHLILVVLQTQVAPADGGGGSSSSSSIAFGGLHANLQCLLGLVEHGFASITVEALSEIEVCTALWYCFNCSSHAAA